MILAKCISSIQEKCIKIPIESLSYDVTVRLISSLTPFSYNAQLVFYVRKMQDFGRFAPILFTSKCNILVTKYSGTALRLFDVK